MKELDIAYRIKRHLNNGAEKIDPAVANKLFIARQNALARQKLASSRLRFAGALGNASFDMPLPSIRALLVVVALAFGVVGVSVWNDYQRAAEYEEIDSALLADDLPINAYLDRGFQAWLEQHSQH